MDSNEIIEANANLVLWCVHVLGMDDVHAAPSHAAAVARASELNTALERFLPPNDILCFSYAAPWPHSKESHAEDVQTWNERK